MASTQDEALVWIILHLLYSIHVIYKKINVCVKAKYGNLLSNYTDNR